MTSSTPTGYTVATALETIAICQLAGASMAEARSFIQSGTPLATVRATLLERRAAAAEPELNHHRPAKSGAPDPWGPVLDSLNKAK